MKLSTILFLTENRAEFILKKQGDKLSAIEGIDANEVLIKLQEADPSRNKQYLQWLVNQYLKKQFRLEDVSRIHDELLQFESIKNRIEQKDINQYDYYKLGELLQSIFGKDTELDIDVSDPELDVLYDGPLGLLVVPKTEEASCKAGSGTKWCTAARKNNKFGHYNETGPLYIWKDKSGEKYQFHFEHVQFMDAQDRPIDSKVLQQMRTSHPVLSKLFKQKEKELIDYPPFTVYYATDVIKGRWPEAEPYIIRDQEYIYWYILNVINDRWPEAEPYIMKDPDRAYDYAKDFIKGRWLEAEPYIKQDPSRWSRYKRIFNISP